MKNSMKIANPQYAHPNRKPAITFYSGADSVTGANFMFETDGEKLLFDCGMVQGEKFADDINREKFPYDPSEIDYLFITHAHIDHIGRVPKLVKEGFSGKIISTEATKRISEVMFEDALSIMEKEKKDGEEPMYHQNDSERALSLWDTIDYHKIFKTKKGLSIEAKDSGHILGSAMYEVTFENDGKKEKIMFTGDLGNSPTPLLPDTEAISGLDYLVMESVYGDRNHEGTEHRKENLLNVIKEVIDKKGTLLIPAFSIEKTQVILYEINEMVEGGLIKEVPVFLDSPLAIRVTEIYNDLSENLKVTVRKDIKGGDEIFNFPGLSMTMRTRDSIKIAKTKGPKIIIAGSGMSTGGRILHHELNYLGEESTTILFLGYQAVGSLGREIQEGAKSVLINNQKVDVNAKIETITGYSSHKDSENLLEFVSGSAETLKRVFVVLGEPKSALFLTQRIRDYLGVKALHPQSGETYVLD